MITVPLPVYRLRAAQRGSALIMVIFLITMLGMIVYAMFNIVKHDTDLAIAQKQAFRARQVAEIGINWAMNPAIKPYDRNFLEQTLEDGATFSAKIRSEGGKININALLQRMANDPGGVYEGFLDNLLTLWGFEDIQERQFIINNLIDWTDADSTSHHDGMERPDFQKDPNYGENTPYPFNRPFYDLKEMTLVPGFVAVVAKVPDWRDYFTIYSSTGTIDVDSAEAKVLAAVTTAIKNDDIDDYNALMKDGSELQELIGERWGDDKLEDTDDDKKLGKDAYIGGLAFSGDEELNMANVIFGADDQTTRIECVATVGDYRKRVVLVVRGRTGQPQILSREEVPIFE